MLNGKKNVLHCTLSFLMKLHKFVVGFQESMEVETPAPLSVAPPTPAIPEETENVELNQQQPIEQQLFVTSPLNNDGQMLPPGTPAHISNEQVNTEEQVTQ